MKCRSMNDPLRLQEELERFLRNLNFSLELSAYGQSRKSKAAQNRSEDRLGRMCRGGLGDASRPVYSGQMADQSSGRPKRSNSALRITSTGGVIRLKSLNASTP